MGGTSEETFAVISVKLEETGTLGKDSPQMQHLPNVGSTYVEFVKSDDREGALFEAMPWTDGITLPFNATCELIAEGGVKVLVKKVTPVTGKPPHQAARLFLVVATTFEEGGGSDKNDINLRDLHDSEVRFIWAKDEVAAIDTLLPSIDVQSIKGGYEAVQRRLYDGCLLAVAAVEVTARPN